MVVVVVMMMGAQYLPKRPWTAAAVVWRVFGVQRWVHCYFLTISSAQPACWEGEGVFV